MIDENPNELRKNLLIAYKEGSFLKAVHDIALTDYRNNKKELEKELISLHNEEIINAITEFNKLYRDSKDVDFFITRHILIDILPELKASEEAVMWLVKHLVNEAGNDMTAGQPFSSFFKYCQKDPSRPSEVLRIVLSSCEELSEFIPLAINAGSIFELETYVNKAIHLTCHENIKVKTQAVFALGNIDYHNNKTLMDDALKAIINIINSENNDSLLSSTIRSLFSLYISNNELEHQIYEQLDKVFASHNGDYVLHVASEILFLHTDKLSSSITDLLLKSLKRVKLKNKETIRNIEYGLVHLINKNQEEKTITFLEDYLIQNEECLSINLFSYLKQEILKNTLLLNKVSTRWFLSKKVKLCQAIFDIVREGHREDIILSIDKNLIKKHQNQGACLFIARKAVGWLFTNPISCTSFILSLMEFSKEDEASEIAELLFNPLMMSYHDKVKRYLEDTIPLQSERLKKLLLNSLSKLKEYQEGLISTQNIPELLPTQAQREAHSRLINKQFNESFKIAQKNSIMNLIATKYILLYGRKSIHHVDTPDGSTGRMENVMNKIESSALLPSLELLDPNGLDFMLRIFRVEGCQK